MFIKGKVKPCSGNRSFCRSIPKVKPLNQHSVIFPKPLLSCWRGRRIAPAESKGSSAVLGRLWLSSWLCHSSPGQPWASLPVIKHLGPTAGDAPLQLPRTGTSARWCKNLNAKECRWRGGDKRDTPLPTRLRFKRWVGIPVLLLQPGLTALSRQPFSPGPAGVCAPEPPKPCRSQACPREAPLQQPAPFLAQSL